MKTLAIIPARGGSKGIPGKNIKDFCGKPLIAWTIQAALQCPKINSVIVSTDSDEIAKIAIEFGAEVPFLRPSDLSTDEASTISVVTHILENVGADYQSIILLQPTSPLRTLEDIDQCLALASSAKANSVVSVCEATIHPNLLYSLSPQGTLNPFMTSQTANRRQDYPSFHQINGAIYYAQIDWLIKQQKFVSDESLAFIMPAEKSVDIDTLFDWHLAEFLKSKNP